MVECPKVILPKELALINTSTSAAVSHLQLLSLTIASDDSTLRSRSLLRRRHLPSQAKVRSTVQRSGSFTHPFWPSGRRTMTRSQWALS